MIWPKPRKIDDSPNKNDSLHSLSDCETFDFGIIEFWRTKVARRQTLTFIAYGNEQGFVGWAVWGREIDHRICICIENRTKNNSTCDDLSRFEDCSCLSSRDTGGEEWEWRTEGAGNNQFWMVSWREEKKKKKYVSDWFHSIIKWFEMKRGGIRISFINQKNKSKTGEKTKSEKLLIITLLLFLTVIRRPSYVP